MRYFARWPILDDSYRLSELQEEALDDLAARLEHRGLVAFGDVVWSTESVDTEEGEVVELWASVDVRYFRRDAA